ncbi:female sterile (1) M3 [Musca autumnalis]|uniref:female sterile (1) M3 n=1 Tax=Musca autumnalis TaxID=221902 RepID=UPI003CF60FB9
MILRNICIIFLIIPYNHGDFIQQHQLPQFHPFTPVWFPEPPPPPPCPLHPFPLMGNVEVSPHTSHFVEQIKSSERPKPIDFKRPFLDIEIEVERNIHVLQDSIDGGIFIVHGHELFQMFLSHEDKRISLMGYLEGNVKIMEPLGAEIISWRGHYLLVVVLDNYLEVYQIRKDIMESRAKLLKSPPLYAEPAPLFPALQELTLNGRFQKLFLLNIADNEVVLIVTTAVTKLQGKVSTFKWRLNGGFELIQDLTLPAVSVVNVIGSKEKYLITGKSIKPQTKTILNIYELDQASLHLMNKQTLMVDSAIVHSATFQKHNLIVACSKKSPSCKSYVQNTNGEFQMLQQKIPQQLAFDYFKAKEEFIMASQQNRVMIFTDHYLDCYGSFTSDLWTITGLMAYPGPRGETYVLLLLKTPFKLLIRTVEMELGAKYRVTRASSDGDDDHKQFLISMAEQLRSFLPERKVDPIKDFFNPRRRTKTTARPNILQRFTDIFSPSRREEEEETPSNPLTELYNRFMQARQPQPREEEQSGGSYITQLLNRFTAVREPPEPRQEESSGSGSITNIIRQMMGVIQQQPQTNQKEEPQFSVSSLSNVFYSLSDAIRPKREVKLAGPVTLNSGKVKRIKILNQKLRSPQEILAKVKELKTKYLLGYSEILRKERSDEKGPLSLTLNVDKQIRVKKVKAENLIYSKEVIKGFLLNQTSRQLVIEPKIKTQLLNATEIVEPSNVRATRQFVPDLYYGLTPSIRAKHLHVTAINDLPWEDFYESLFLKQRDTTIYGRLIIQSSMVEVQHLKTTMLNHLIVDNLFNMRQPQVVNSQLSISRFFVRELEAETVNGLKFEDDIVFSGRNAYVETPVTMHHLSISGDLIVADKKIERQNPDEMEFKHFYTNKVIINGTLVLGNVRRDKENESKIIIGDEEFREEDIKERYLLRNEEQEFKFPVIIDNAKLVAPNLETRHLNDHITEEHMLVDKINASKPLLLVFMKADIPGDVICRDYKSKLAEINENIIRPGDEVLVTGKKHFTAPLATDEMETELLNETPVDDLVFKPELVAPIRFQGLKVFDKIIVRNPCFVETGIEAMNLNNLPLEDLLNYDYHMDYISVSYTLMASNIVFHKINGIPFDDFFAKLNVEKDQLILRKDLIVEGNVLFAEPLELKYINGLQWDSYVENLVRNHESAVIEGKVCFAGDLVVQDELVAAEVNNYVLETIFSNILLKSKPQLITGQYTFNQLQLSNLDVLSINSRKVKDFVHLSQADGEFVGDIVAPKVVVRGNLRGPLRQTLNFDNISANLKNITKKSWRNLKVMGNLKWNTSKEGAINTDYELLKYLYKYAVKSNQDQVISGNVKLIYPIIDTMKTRLKFPPNIDLEFIDKDALDRNSNKSQTIEATKMFQQPVFMEQVELRKDIISGVVNNIDITAFNASLYRVSSKMPLKGPLKFLEALNIGHMSLRGLLNGVNTSGIYQIQNHSILPPIAANQLFLDNHLNLQKINHMDLEYFLEQRVPLTGPALEVFGFLTFENLIIENAVLLQSINGLHIDNMVFRHSPHLQTITGHKTVSSYLELAGPAHVMHLNGKELMEIYRNSLFNNRNYQFDNLVIEKASFEKGLNILNSEMRQRSFDGSSPLESLSGEGNFMKFLKTIDKKLSTNSGDILYLDYDVRTRIKWQDSNATDKDRVQLREISRLSCCEKKFLKITLPQNRKHEILLQNITSNRLSAFHDNVAVKVENFCKLKHGKVKSKITISAAKLFKVFGMKRFVESIHIMATKMAMPQEEFVILHGLDLPSRKRNEVRIFKIDYRNDSISEWQGLITNIGDKLQVFHTQNHSWLITNGLVNNHPALSVYSFEKNSQKFKFQQIIDGDYDIIEMLQFTMGHNLTNHHHQLILSCRKCHKIYIYEPSDKVSVAYQIFQILSLKSPIAKIFTFTIKSDYYLMVILDDLENSYYHLYKYSYIQGWVHKTYGFYPNLHMAVPLGDNSLEIAENSDSLGLMILCNFDNCHLVNAVVRR